MLMVAMRLHPSPVRIKRWLVSKYMSMHSGQSTPSTKPFLRMGPSPLVDMLETFTTMVMYVTSSLEFTRDLKLKDFLGFSLGTLRPQLWQNSSTIPPSSGRLNARLPSPTSLFHFSSNSCLRPSLECTYHRLALIPPSFRPFDKTPMAFLPSMRGTLPKMEASPSNVAKKQEHPPVLRI